MPEEYPTLNDELVSASSAPTTPDPDPSAPLDTPSVPDDKGGEPDPAINEQAAPTTPTEKPVKADPEPEKDKPAPFHEHPDWQRMKRERDDAVRQLTEVRTPATPQPPVAEGRDYNKELQELHHLLNEGDISATEHATKMVDILQARSDEKIQVENMRLMDSMQKQQRAHEIESAFYRDNPDFHGMMESGKIAQVRGSSPMHDDFSAYYAAKLADVEASIDQKIADARKETREQTIKEIQAGQHAQSLDGSPVVRPNLSSDKDDLSKVDIKKAGGVNKILSEKLGRMRARK